MEITKITIVKIVISKNYNSVYKIEVYFICMTIDIRFTIF